ncbi:P-loop containing nucleoside triphosphate hydrolase protein [Serendipita vermifera]|nr:P-loop containing nucleoside triphosphate hydrolase protein [Serendipita vermifera]
MAEDNTQATPQSRIIRYDQYYDYRTFQYFYRKTDKSAQASKKLNRKNPVLVVRRMMDSKGRHYDTRVDIKSKGICQVLMDINEDLEGLDLLRGTPECDPSLFFHSYQGLKERIVEENAKNEPDQALLSDLEVLIVFVEEHFEKAIGDLKVLLPKSMITFDTLWAIFKPNTYLYTYDELTEQFVILLLRQFQETYDEANNPMVQVACDHISDDGRLFGVVRSTVFVASKYEGARRIQDLPIYPLSYHDDPHELREKGIARGRKFVEMNTKRREYLEVKGAAMREISEMGKPRQIKFNAYGRVMIDHSAFRLFQPNTVFNSSIIRQLDRQKLDDNQCLICSPVVLGFCFGTKTWGGFAIERLEQIKWSNEAFRSLVLGEKQKALVQALVKQHAERSKLFDDIVIGKGKGLVGLLAGPPGCGKTLTAEAVAEVTRRPLYVISAGELGTNSEVVDQKLTQILELAQTWNAVLLLDEAEVFLQQRNNTDVHRNALVSIFLRQLEYYQGILILTTNLITQCDVAFESRIHFSINYSNLDFTSRKAIWNVFIEKIAIKKQISEEEIEILAKEEMNGRQVRGEGFTTENLVLICH